MKPASLKLRVTLLTVGVIATVIVVVSSVAYVELAEALTKPPDKALRSVAAVVQAQLGPWPPQPAQDDLGALLKRVALSETMELLAWPEGVADPQIAHTTNPELARAWVSHLASQERPPLGQERLLTLHGAGRPYRAIWFLHAQPGGALSVLVAMPRSYAQHEMGEFLRLLVVLGAGMLVAGGILAAASVWWVMRPLRATARRLEKVTHSNLGAEHLSGLAVPAELEPVVQSVRAMLARVNEGVQAQKRFIADASHELRTPLTLAKSTIQAARLRTRSDEEYRRALDELAIDVDRLTRLVAQLLDLARLEENAPGAAEDVDVGALLRGVAESYDARATAAGGRIVCDVGERPLVVRGSPTDLESLFWNLVDNALQHGPKGGTITLRASGDDGLCRATVHDEGGGIAPEELGRLFGRFYRADASRSRATGGSGLGLAIARQVALRHGGDIEIASAPAEGTTATVRLPLAAGRA